MFVEFQGWLLVYMLLGGCIPGLTLARPQPNISAPALAPVTHQVEARLSPASAQQSARDHYRFEVVFDYHDHSLEVEEQITYTNRQADALPELVLVVEPNRFPGAFVLHAITWGGTQMPVADWTLRGATLTLRPKAVLQQGDTAQVQISYRLSLPRRAGYFGYTARQTNLGDWYPFVAPLTADGEWLFHNPANVGEHTVYPLADYELMLSGPDLNILQIAASAAGVSVAGGVRFVLDSARNFAWSASPEYQVATRIVDGVTIAAYWFAEHERAGHESLNATAQALSLYNKRFAPYPHTQLSSVEADFNDGMEFDGLYFLGEEYYAAYAGDPTGYLTMLSAHETAHQWWYGLVGNDQALEPFLDEAFATYSELLFYEQYYPQLTDWWWGYRVQRFHPRGCVNSTIYDFSGFRPYVNAVYLRGAEFLHDVRQALGDTQFDAFMRDYTDAGRSGIASSATLKSSLRTVFNGNLDPLLRSYCLAWEQ